MGLDDDLPPPRVVRSAPALWWVLAAIVAIAVAFLIWRPDGPRSAPAERGATPVTAQPVQLPAR